MDGWVDGWVCGWMGGWCWNGRPSLWRVVSPVGAWRRRSQHVTIDVRRVRCYVLLSPSISRCVNVVDMLPASLLTCHKSNTSSDWHECPTRTTAACSLQPAACLCIAAQPVWNVCYECCRSLLWQVNSIVIWLLVKRTNAVYLVALRLLVTNISSSSPAINKLRRLLPAISVTTCHGTVLITPSCLSVYITRWSQIVVRNRYFCLLDLHLTRR